MLPCSQFSCSTYGPENGHLLRETICSSRLSPPPPSRCFNPFLCPFVDQQKAFRINVIRWCGTNTFKISKDYLSKCHFGIAIENLTAPTTSKMRSLQTCEQKPPYFVQKLQKNCFEHIDLLLMANLVTLNEGNQLDNLWSQFQRRNFSDRASFCFVKSSNHCDQLLNVQSLCDCTEVTTKRKWFVYLFWNTDVYKPKVISANGIEFIMEV